MFEPIQEFFFFYFFEVAYISYSFPKLMILFYHFFLIFNFIFYELFNIYFVYAPTVPYVYNSVLHTCHMCMS